MKTQDIRNMALAFQAVIENKSLTEDNVSSGEVIHDLPTNARDSHAAKMKKTHGVKTTFRYDKLKYHGSKPQVKKALGHLYGPKKKDGIEDEHPHLYEAGQVKSNKIDGMNDDKSTVKSFAKKHGVTVKMHPSDHHSHDYRVSYHGDHAAVKNAVAAHHGDHDTAKDEHPHLYSKKTNEAVYTEKKLDGDQHELDHDKDGDIDAADFKGLRNKGKKDKKSKVEVKPTQKMDADKSQEEATKESTELESLETHIKETYVGVQSGMRQAMMQMWEKAAHAGANGKIGAPGEEIDSKDSVTAKKMRMDHKAEVNDTEEKGHKDAAAAGRVGPKAAARNGDNMKGDKAIINPVKGTT